MPGPLEIFDRLFYERAKTILQISESAAEQIVAAVRRNDRAALAQVITDYGSDVFAEGVALGLKVGLLHTKGGIDDVAGRL